MHLLAPRLLLPALPLPGEELLIRGNLHTILDDLTNADIEMLMETEEEHGRRGELVRIFPSEVSGKYLQYAATATCPLPAPYLPPTCPLPATPSPSCFASLRPPRSPPAGFLPFRTAHQRTHTLMHTYAHTYTALRILTRAHTRAHAKPCSHTNRRVQAVQLTLAST